jgi:hypothetical protein|nr:MAG TPA: hypothetical protein [Bacteriophage sp.]
MIIMGEIKKKVVNDIYSLEVEDVLKEYNDILKEKGFREEYLICYNTREAGAFEKSGKYLYDAIVKGNYMIHDTYVVKFLDNTIVSFNEVPQKVYSVVITDRMEKVTQ